MTTKSLHQPRFQQLKTLRALAVGLAIGFTAPAFADNLPEVQRLIKQGQFPQALEKVDAYLSSRPKDAQGRFLKGLIFTELNKPAEAIGVFTKLTEDYPELPEPYNNLAVLYAQQKQYDKARTALEMAIRTHPSYAIAYENLGDIYAKLASQAYDKALQLDSANSTTQNKLALIRDLISTSGKGNVKPTAPVATAPLAPPPVAVAPPAVKPVPTAPVAPPPVAVAPPAVKPVPVATSVTPPATKPTTPPTATVVASTPGAAASSKPVDAKPVDVKPAPVAATPATPAAASATANTADAASDDVAKAVSAWAGAWSRKDMKGYFSSYAGDFATPKGMTRKAWEEERQERIAGKSGKISVTIDAPQISVSGDKATAKFRQTYQAPGMNSSTNKTLTLVRSGSRWLIQEEKSR